MKKKLLSTLLGMALIISIPIFMADCAKKQVKVEKGVTSAQKAEEKGTGKVQTGVTEEYKKREAERQARLKALEEQQKLYDEMEAFMSEKIYFDFDKSDLRPEAQAILKKKAEWLKKHPEFFLKIEGHCDERGTAEYNLALGYRRAQAAKNFLVSLGVSPARIRTISYGEERPIDPRHNEEAWAKNRRDEFKLIK